MAEEKLYAFGKTDADFLISMIKTSGTTSPLPKRPVEFTIVYGVTGGSGIAADSSGLVYERTPTTTGWTTSTIEYTAYNLHPTAAIAADTRVVMFPVNGRWAVLWEACP